MIDQAKEQNEATILVDAGNWAETKGFEPWEKSSFIFEMMGKLGYDAITPGDRELTQGIAPLKDLLATQPEVEVVSANITDKQGNLVWPEYTVIERGGVKFGVTGVTGGTSYAFNIARGLQEVDEFDFQDSREALRRVIPKVRQEADLVVVLLHETPGDARRMVDEIPGMDVVIVGHNPGYMFNPDRIGNTLMVRGGNRGQYLSTLDVTLDGSGKVIDYNGEGKPLGKAVAEKPGLDSVVKAWEADFKAREQADKQQSAVQEAIREGTDHYIGADMCARCHVEEFAGWNGSPHARAVLSDPPTGAAAEGLDLTNVQCEHCHGMGTFHGTRAMVTEVAEATCAGCHGSEGVEGVDLAAILAGGYHSR